MTWPQTIWFTVLVAIIARMTTGFWMWSFIVKSLGQTWFPSGWMRWDFHQIRPCESRSRITVLISMRKIGVWNKHTKQSSSNTRSIEYNCHGDNLWIKKTQLSQILRSVFRAGLDLKNNIIYQDFVKYHADGTFWEKVRQGCGFAEEEPDLGRLAIHLLMTASTRTMRRSILQDWIA